MAAFVKLLPERLDGLELRHALEVRHESFCCREFVDLARQFGAAIVCADSGEHPAIAYLTSDFVCARLQRSRDEIVTGYSPQAFTDLARTVKSWANGHAPEGLDYICQPAPSGQGRDVHVCFISGGKCRNPAAALALAERREDRKGLITK